MAQTKEAPATYLAKLQETIHHQGRYLDQARQALPLAEAFERGLLALGFSRALVEPYPCRMDASGPYLPLQWVYEKGFTVDDDPAHRHFQALTRARVPQYRLVLKITARHTDRIEWTWRGDPEGQYPSRRDSQYQRHPERLRLEEASGTFGQPLRVTLPIPEEVVEYLKRADWTGPQGNRSFLVERVQPLVMPVSGGGQ